MSSTLNRNSADYADIALLTEQNHLFMEPAITFRIGWERLKVQLQYIYSYNFNGDTNYKFEKQYFSLGLLYQVNANKKQELPK